MATAYGALCTDFFVNQKLGLHMDLPRDREAVLGLFDRLRKVRPAMTKFNRYAGELALESKEEGESQEWVALRRTSIRSGVVNPDSIAEAFAAHRAVMEIAPYFLSISALDVSGYEVMFGFDFEVEANRNELVFDALMGRSGLAGVVDREREDVIDSQPSISFALDEARQFRAVVDVRTRVRSTEAGTGRYEPAPITVHCAVRRDGPVDSIDHLPRLVGEVGARVEQLVDDRIVPQIISPIRDAILSRPG